MTEKFKRLEIPPIHDYWVAPLPKDFGDESNEPVFKSVGYALTTWEQIETILSRMFQLFVESNSDAAMRAFGSISSASGRREALDMAAEIYASKKKQLFPVDDFKLLMKHIGQASVRRNEIAHGIATSFNLDGKSHGFFLVPASYLSRKNEARTLDWWKQIASSTNEDQFSVFGSKYRYTSTDIDHFSNLFDQLLKQANGLYFEQFLLYSKSIFDAAPADQKLTLQLGEQQKAQPPRIQ